MAGASTYPTGTDLITEALAHLGVATPGDALEAASLTSAFFTLQGIIDSYAAQKLLIFNRTIIGSFSTVAGKQTYTLGVANTNDWQTSFLPPEIDLLTMSLGTLEFQIGVDTAAEWGRIAIKSLQSNIIQECWPDYGAASHSISFYPCPNASIPINLYLLNPVQRLSAPGQVIQLPPGYQECIVFELTIKCSSKFGQSIPAWIPEAYADIKATVKANNFDPIDLYCDAALVKPGLASGGGSRDFYIGK